MAELPRILDQPQDFLRELNQQEPEMAKQVVEWIMGPLDSGDVEALLVEGESGPEYASRVPETDIQVYWRVTERGRTQVFFIDWV